MKIVLATWNKTKVCWLTRGFSPLNLKISPLNKDKINDIQETGRTASENALLKVRSIGIKSNSIIIGEDSVLSIDALNGFPGVETARWMEGNDDDRSIEILAKMKNISDEKRSAKFISSLAVLFPNGDEKIFEGCLKGNISFKLVGFEGSGYQRIFLLSNGDSIAESGNNFIKQDDHRDRAIKKAIVGINNWLKNNAE